VKQTSRPKGATSAYDPEPTESWVRAVDLERVLINLESRCTLISEQRRNSGRGASSALGE
jgi:hypothetical protein